MTELSLHILDIANNATRANATRVRIAVVADYTADTLTVTIADDGLGMDKELLARVSDPFATTRTTRRVGMGIPLFRMSAELSGGKFSIASEKGIGTTVTASFGIGHIDRPPLGDLSETLVTLIGGAPLTDFELEYCVDGRDYRFNTREVKQLLDESDLSDITILNYLKEMLSESINDTNGGRFL